MATPFEGRKVSYDGYQYDNQAYQGMSMDYLPTETAPSKFTRRNKRIIAIAFVVVVLAALIIGLSVGLSTSKSDDNESGNTGAQGGTQKTSTSTTSTTKPTSTVTSPMTSKVSTTVTSTSTASPTAASTTTEQPTNAPTTSPTQSTPTSTSPPTTTEARDWLSEPCFTEERQCPWSADDNPLLLVSLDGFRAEYLLRNLTPHLEKLRTCGVHTPYMRAVYPTVTFPNHYTIVTGLYPAAHGIVGNYMYDPVHNESFKFYAGEERFHSFWWGGEPLWTTAKKQGKKSGSFFWVGSEYNISGHQPDEWFPGFLNWTISFETRADKAIEWLTRPGDERMDFVTLYFGEPDTAGHNHKPDSPEVDAMLKTLDDGVGYLMDSLLRHNIDQCVNLIILADHGMASTSCERQINLGYYEKAVEDMLMYSGTAGYIHTEYKQHGNVVEAVENPMPTEEVIDALTCKSSHVRLFSQNNIPLRHHYSGTPRIGDVIVDVDDRWFFSAKKMSDCLAGHHGFDNIYKSMHTIFIAHGPGFKQGISTEAFENIELYNMMADLLDITPAPNNGTAGALNHLLKTPSSHPANNTHAQEVCPVDTTESCACGSSYNAPSSGEGVFPSGIPARDGANTCLFHGTHVAGLYSPLYKTASLISFPLTADQVNNHMPVSNDCLRDQTSCTDFWDAGKRIEPVRLFDPGFVLNTEDQAGGLVWWNKVPMFTGFKDGIWSYVTRLVKEYAVKYDAIHVSTGPAYDYNLDSLGDQEHGQNTVWVDNARTVPLPTHFYMLVVKCSDRQTSLDQCPHDKLDTLSFILPHENTTNNCLPSRNFILNNVARIRDIELLIGVQFFPDIEWTLAARSRTFLPTELWPSPSETPWADLPCPVPDDPTCPAGPKPLLLVSLDGFRAEYFERHLTPTIARLAQCGVHTPYMRSVYPTVTFPNHYTIVTGQYPESHGIVGNNMYDEDIDKIFSLSAYTAKDPRWWKGEPIWITAKKQNMKTGTFFWPGADVNISGVYPDLWKPYDGKVGYPERVMEVLDWIALPAEERPGFITLYFDQPDHAGHNSGPESDEVNGMLETVDKLINLIMTSLYEKNLHNCINMIIVADHGMSPQSCARTISVKDFYPNITEMLMFDRTLGQIFPQFQEDSRYDASRLPNAYPGADIVDSLMCKASEMKVFTKDTLPRRHHFTNSDRIADILIDMKDEWLVLQDKTSWCTGGNHGWDNINKNMHAIFLAHGPAFRENFTASPFENIELYDLMSEVIGIKPSPNNGTIGSLHYMLRDGIPVPSDPANVTAHAQCSWETTDEYLDKICNCELNSNTAAADTFLPPDITSADVPEVVVNDTVCLLNQTGYSMGYSQTFRTAVWMSFELRNDTAYPATPDSPCILNDTRVDHQTCSSTGNRSSDVVMVPLSRFVSADGTFLSSTLVPLYQGFYYGIYSSLQDLIKTYLTMYGDLSVTMGIIYDYNNDGLWEGIINATKYTDITNIRALPSHIYVTLIKCRNNEDTLPCSGDLDILSFILPNLPEAPNCLRPELYFKDNVGRIRDIELLAGLRFMTSKEVPLAARWRTYLPEALWETGAYINSWDELPCPDVDMCKSEYRPTLLISLDGFRADYLLRNVTPTISRLSQCGVRAPYMRSVYPTKTFPNHYTIVTGLYPESHGIIDNNMYDRDIDKRFYLGSPTSSDPRWWGGEPIWLTAKKQGLRTATYFWPGSDVNITGQYPDIWKKYDGSVPYSTRVREVVSWMALPAGERPDFITLYFDEPDLAGHKNGPSNKAEMNAALVRVDETLGELMRSLYDRQLHHCVNLVLIADHGMADVSCSKVVRLRNYVDYEYLSDNFYVWEGPFGRIADTYIYNSTRRDISPVDEAADSVDLVANLTCASPHMTLYRKSTLPVRHHYSNHERIDNMLLDMETGWLSTRSYIRSCSGGNHGYDNIYKSMEALFLAYGPAFKWNMTIEPFENIELYNMFTDILGITAASNNGTRGSLNHILQHPKPVPAEDNFADYQPSNLLHASAQAYTAHVTGFKCYENCSGITEDMLTSIYSSISSGTPTSEATPLGSPPKIRQLPGQPRNVTQFSLPGASVGYDVQVQTPLWVSQTVTVNATVQLAPSRPGCVIPDPRLVSDPTACRPGPVTIRHSLLWGTPVTSSTPAAFYLPSVIVKMRQDFITNVWTPLVDFINARLTVETHLLVGPAFDNNHDSLPDSLETLNSTAVPSHFFIVITQCTIANVTMASCRSKDLKISSYILPHTANITVCKDFSTYMLENEARLRDVELISGISFMADLPLDEAAILKTRLPVSRV